MTTRRSLLTAGLGLAGGLLAVQAFADVLPPLAARRVGFNCLHTGERLDIAYFENGAYVPTALTAVNHVLRDWRDNETHEIAPQLLDLLTALSAKLGTTGAVDVICGYRSPATNAMLHARSSEVAVGSLHLKGQAIDIRVPGVDTARVRDAAQSLAIGGVGYYPTSDFVHVDIGRVRRWQGT
jgi:uncharacterized protein YcbK (DUF882 family)